MTQSEAVLAWLREGNSLTALDALQRFGTLRLGARIYDLKRAGHSISKRMVITRSGKIVAEYRLVQTEPVICRAVSANAGASAPYVPGTHSDA